ncbi:TRAP transporter substrate-binding protein DctP [Eoetvoesiella caeni]
MRLDTAYSAANNKSRKTAAGLLIVGLAAMLWGGVSLAQEVTLKAVSSFTPNTFFSQHFEMFVKKVNDEGKGLVQINYIGGPSAVPPFEVGNSVQSGVVDLANVTGVFYTNVVPEAIVMSYTDKSTDELRSSGAIDYMNSIMAPKGLVYQARLSENLPYHLYSNKAFTGSLKGHKIRITPVYREFFMALGGTVVQTSPGELYTALERGVVDGYGWAIAGVFDLGWQEKTKYRVDPGFYSSENGILMNLKSWNKLNPEQQAFLTKQFKWAEAQNVLFAGKVKQEVQRQADAGIEVIALDDQAAAQYLKLAKQTAQERTRTVSPQYGEKLIELFWRR